uniref:Uncharacterized protein n=1 Tax=Meloidogyne enterolobii TaxID=390850 RepID=A0A6V7W5F8_MELEN|nr:unnamed protein product [Meloidogyne enterolobii]
MLINDGCPAQLDGGRWSCLVWDPLFSSMVACLLIGLGEYAHWTGWWKNMLVCWVVENMLIGW